MDPCDVLLVLLVCATRVQVSLQGANEKRLYRDLMVNYNPLVRPVLNESESLMVKLGFHLMQIVDVDEKNQVLTTNVWFQMSWNDYQLLWNTSDYNGVSTVRFPDHLLWKPDILLYNSADEKFDATYHTNVLVNQSGGCLFLPPAIFKSTCYIDVRWFPFDIQKCDLKFGSWTYGGWSVDLTMLEADISNYIANVEWDLVVVSGKKNDRIYECCPEPYPDVTYTIVIRRRTLYYGLNLLLPCVLISILALLVFLLPADSGEKISLAQYFVTTMVIVAVSIIATVVVLQFHHHDPDGAKMPKWVRVLLLNWCARFLFMKRSGVDKNIPRCNLPGMDPIGPQLSTNGKDEVFLAKGQSSTVGSTEPELVKILEEVRYIAKHFHDQDVGKTTCNDWKFASAVIDRLCFMIFSLVIIVCTFGILMSAPNFAEAISKDVFS
ncbi:neuronal acetylcholine receptor subunit alpha-7a isoform X2 [Dunckerocampus dactyliophorus]|uniref:neuronal acetylcholine receptor subunit alpha-7a isoform X2 n=1 Tax=Dunckerocampus dactyliophorus TaxID=161453 RepID=UPI002404EE8B|nr:neuronal acetylcholine receptor subunit alpha-7a isoform X2 [Dunckerocampus dactyliophorus]